MKEIIGSTPRIFRCRMNGSRVRNRTAVVIDVDYWPQQKYYFAIHMLFKHARLYYFG
jgi:hypothetical protein